MIDPMEMVPLEAVTTEALYHEITPLEATDQPCHQFEDFDRPQRP